MIELDAFARTFMRTAVMAVAVGMGGAVALAASAEQVHAPLRPNLEAGRQHGMQGASLLAKGHLSEAKIELVRAILLNPADHVAHINLGIIQYRESEWGKSIFHFSQALVSRPKTNVALMMRGMAFVRLAEYDEAIEDFSRAIANDHGLATAFAGRALALQKKGDASRAIADANAAMSLGLVDPEIYRTRGLALEALGHRERGGEDLQMAVLLEKVRHGASATPAATTEVVSAAESQR